MLDVWVRDLGFDSFSLVGIVGFPIDPESGMPPYAATVSPEWQAHYITHDLFFKDPLPALCLTTSLPLTSDGLPLHQMRGSAKEALAAAWDFGVDRFVCLPIHGPGGTVSALWVYGESGAAAFDEARQNTQDLLVMAAFIHEALRRLVGRPDPVVRLTRRERECLQWLSQNRTAEDIGGLLGISERTVAFHLQNAMHKLGTTNRWQAVVRAVSLGLIRI